MKNVTVTYNSSKWFAVPANNGGNGPTWQWGDELLVGYTSGEAQFTQPGHQVDYINPHLSCLARSRDGGETWVTWQPDCFVGKDGFKADDAVVLTQEIDFLSSGFVMRIEGNGYHGNSGHQWFYSYDKGASWKGPFTFGNLLEHPELAGKEFTGRTAYLINSSTECFVFLSVRNSDNMSLGVSTSDKVFLAKTTDGGRTFDFVSWVVPPVDPYRAVMPAPVRISQDELITAIRRKNDKDECWVDCYCSMDNGRSWEFLSMVGYTGRSNGNPPAMIRMADERICCVYGNRDRCVILARYSEDNGETWGREQVLRSDFNSVNGCADLGYPRVFQRLDGKLIAIYFWCSNNMLETHIEATIFNVP